MSKITWQISNVRVLIQTQIWSIPKLFSTLFFLNLKTILEANLGMRGAGQGPYMCIRQIRNFFLGDGEKTYRSSAP